MMNANEAPRGSFSIDGLLSKLAKERPIFHSEADLQHAFAWLVHQQFPDARIRLEMPIKLGRENARIDLRINHKGNPIAIELKYKIQKLTINEAGELYELKSHSAHDCGRYDFIKDIGRLERITADNPKVRGYAILLTNDSAYWKPPTKRDTADAAFQLHERGNLDGKMAWSKRASAGTTQSREDPIHLDGSYELHWKDYSLLREDKYPKFRYLAVATHIEH